MRIGIAFLLMPAVVTAQSPAQGPAQGPAFRSDINVVEIAVDGRLGDDDGPPVVDDDRGEVRRADQMVTNSALLPTAAECAIQLHHR